MSAVMRAKLKVTSVKALDGVNVKNETVKAVEIVTFCGVSKSDGYDGDGLDENNTYAKWSPQADLSITIANPALFDTFSPGQEFYVDFSAA